MNLITKIYFPREVVPLSSLLSSLFDFTISLVGLIIVLTLVAVVSGDSGPSIVWSVGLLWVPVLIGVLLLMAAALGLFLSCANLFFRDVRYIVQVLMQYGILLSLVYVSYEELGHWGWVFLINPVAPLLEGLRTVVLSGRVDPFLWPWLCYSVAFAGIGFVVACSIFDKAEYLFAEYV